MLFIPSHEHMCNRKPSINKPDHWESDEIGIHDGLKLHRRNNAIRVRILSFPQNNYYMKELDKLKNDLSFILNEMKELSILANKCRPKRTSLKNRGQYFFADEYNALNARRKNILNRINQIRLKYWYWK